ncbi:MAG: sigma 54-interacting transcriptional regulator [Rhodopirellula sp. JB044]|uniref:sigma-54-dependent Fis family transcriptional regulator n=1 Tax=Rhodopirellula sp. JB044 TaxID=3342844 RepID=UPI00370A8314
MLEHHSPLIENPRCLLLDLAQRRDVRDALRLIVDRIAASKSVALTRIWLRRPGLGCDTCRMRPECPDRSECLHLVASAGQSVVEPERDLTKTQGDFQRFPIGVRKVGKIAASGKPLEVQAIEGEHSWIADPAWFQAEGIRGFGGQPLMHRDKVLGVLAVFSRSTISEEDFDWLRTIADHAAASLGNAMAWEEIESLRKRLEMENEYLQEQLNEDHAFGEIVGKSASLRKVTEQIDLVAPTDSTVLITGQSGTGKELVAREIHRRSARADRPLIKVNCAAIPRELYDSEFFGHVKGSFTGAMRDRVGRFELANGGTLFLDEVGEIPLDLQSKLLRVLQEGELERVGEERTREVDVRIIAATNRDLKAESEAGSFRSDLYYRFSVFPIELPPLSQRTEDIPLLAEHLLKAVARRVGRESPRLTKANITQLQKHSWPGNIRELQHVLERALITSRSGRLSFDLRDDGNKPSTDSAANSSHQDDNVMTEQEVRALEAENIRRALQKCNGKVSGDNGAAQLLGIKPTTLASRMKKFNVGRNSNS